MSEQIYHFDKLSEWQKGYALAILKDMDNNLKLDYETRVGMIIRTILTGEKTDE